MKILAIIAILAGSALLAEQSAAEAPLTASQAYSLQAIAEKRAELARENAALVKMQNEVITEACKSLNVPDDKLKECAVTPDLQKVIWRKVAAPEK